MQKVDKFVELYCSKLKLFSELDGEELDEEDDVDTWFKTSISDLTKYVIKRFKTANDFKRLLASSEEKPTKFI